jgi:putative membrane protein
MDIFNAVELAEIVSTIIYTGLGVALMYVSWLVLDLITPFSLRKEIAEQKNLAVAIVVGALFISIATIIAAVIIS